MTAASVESILINPGCVSQEAGGNLLRKVLPRRLRLKVQPITLLYTFHYTKKVVPLTYLLARSLLMSFI